MTLVYQLLDLLQYDNGNLRNTLAALIQPEAPRRRGQDVGQDWSAQDWYGGNWSDSGWYGYSQDNDYDWRDEPSQAKENPYGEEGSEPEELDTNVHQPARRRTRWGKYVGTKTTATVSEQATATVTTGALSYKWSLRSQDWTHGVYEVSEYAEALDKEAPPTKAVVRVDSEEAYQRLKLLHEGQADLGVLAVMPCLDQAAAEAKSESTMVAPVKTTNQKGHIGMAPRTLVVRRLGDTTEVGLKKRPRSSKPQPLPQQQ